MNWVFISDLHVGKSEDRDSRIKEYLDEIRKKYPEYGLIHAGDGANDGLKEQIESFKVFLQPWQDHKKLIHIPGNHDRGWEGFEADEKCVEFWDTIFGSNWKKKTESRFMKSHLIGSSQSTRRTMRGWCSLHAAS